MIVHLDLLYTSMHKPAYVGFRSPALQAASTRHSPGADIHCVLRAQGLFGCSAASHSVLELPASGGRVLWCGPLPLDALLIAPRSCQQDGRGRPLLHNQRRLSHMSVPGLQGHNSPHCPCQWVLCSRAGCHCCQWASAPACMLAGAPNLDLAGPGGPQCYSLTASHTALLFGASPWLCLTSGSDASKCRLARSCRGVVCVTVLL